MTSVITDNIDIWTSAVVSKKATGRGSSKKKEAYGIKKLRELILELAVRGKLVPQIHNDEPASILLEKIAEEKELLIKKAKSKKQKTLPVIREEEKQYTIPGSWQWVRLHDIIQISSGDGLTAARMNKNGNIPVFGGNGITGYHDMFNTDKPTLVIGRVGFYCGSVHITPSSAWVTDNAFKTIFSENNIDIKFLYWLLKGTDLKENENATAQPVISGKKIYPIVVALPPLNEQKRIVSKVEELNALCDKLEEEQEKNSATHQTLVETLLNTLTGVETPEEFSQSWQLIAEHFETLFTTEQSIDKLQETILQLAVMGKLVAQDSSDEPASVLLEEIVKEKGRLVKEGKIKKQKVLPAIVKEDMFFSLPEKWEWTYLNDIVTLLGDGLHGTPNYSENGEYFFINGNNLNNGKILLKPETKKVDTEEYNKYKKKLGVTTVFVSINGTLGNVAFYNNENIVLGKSVCYFNLCENIDKEFIKVLIESPYFMNYASKSATGSTIKNLGVKTMNSLSFALPPLTEQHRIVAKVDELMALCDSLRIAIREQQTIQITLADTVSKQLSE